MVAFSILVAEKNLVAEKENAKNNRYPVGY
jgi:hypothetical protein